MCYNELEKRAAYLKGLADGMKIEDESNTGRLVAQLIELINDMAIAIEEVSAQLDEVDEDLGDLEEYCYDDDCDCGCDCDCDDDCDCDCDDYDYEDGMVQITCPHCGDEVFLDDELLCEEEVICPSCRETIVLDIDCDCDCGCDCEDCE